MSFDAGPGPRRVPVATIVGAVLGALAGVLLLRCLCYTVRLKARELARSEGASASGGLQANRIQDQGLSNSQYPPPPPQAHPSSLYFGSLEGAGNRVDNQDVATVARPSTRPLTPEVDAGPVRPPPAYQDYRSHPE